jgi:hypothetical protein
MATSMLVCAAVYAAIGSGLLARLALRGSHERW